MLKTKSLFCLLVAALSCGIAPRAWADVLYFPGFTVPESVQFVQPEPSCGLDSVPTEATACSLSATTNYTIAAPDGTAIVDIASSYHEGVVTDPYAGDITTFSLWFDNQIFVKFDDTPSTAGGWFQDPLGYAETAPGQNHYVGDAFVDQGQMYYGWFEYNYDFTDENYPPRASDVPSIVVSYAYESCPNAAITVGATSGGATCSDPLDPPDPPASPTPEPGTLILMGTGVFALLYLARRLSNIAPRS